MNTVKLIQTAVALAATALLTQTQLDAQTWRTVEDFQYAPRQSSDLLAMVVGGQGNVYAAGGAHDADANSHALVMRSTDQGISWQAVEDYFPGVHSDFRSLIIDSLRNLYAVGSSTVGRGSQPHWIVRKSSDGGLTWTTVDDYAGGAPDGTGASGASAFGGAVDNAGNVYAIRERHCPNPWL